MAKPGRRQPIGEFALSRTDVQRRIDVRVADERPEASRAPHAAEADWWLSSSGGGLDDPGLAHARYVDGQHAHAAAGVKIRRQATARAADVLRASVRSLRARHPSWSARAIARELLRRDRTEPNDKAVRAMAARIRRLSIR